VVSLTTTYLLLKIDMKSKRGGGNPSATQKLIERNSLRKLDNSVCFVENSTYPRHRLKERIIKQNLIDYKCHLCENEGAWNNKPLPLILDHINGINNDNRLENLRFVCSNCDSQLPTYKNRRGSKGNK
jgi:5-methylcytosine-specific restriction endonuclease McrA